MPKRKRGSSSEEARPEKTNVGEDRALRIRKSRLVAQISRATTLLHRALKIARGFERQKLGRRQKTARENPQDLLRLKEEVIVLKQLDLAKTAEGYLFKQLVRTKRIREAKAFVGVYGEDAEGRIGGVKKGAEANVVGRLMNSNPVREAMPGIMMKVFGCLGLEERASTLNGNNEASKASRPAASAVTSVDHDVGDEVTESSWEGLSQIGEDHLSGESTDTSEDESLAEADSFSTSASSPEDFDGDEDIAQFVHRLASSSPPEPASHAEEDGDSSRSRPPKTKATPPPREPLSLSPSPSTSLSRSSSPSRPLPNSHAKPPPPKPTPAHTTFLPSLTLGGYFSGSDSDSTSNSDPNPYPKHLLHSGPALPQPRKNRRGQRARQQIAEKKFGSGAKHLQKQETQGKGRESGSRSSTANRDAGWDVRKGATGSSGGKAWEPVKGHGRGRPFAKTTGPTGANGEAVTVKPTSKKMDRQRDGKVGGGEGGPLHPSWEAARKRKAQSQQGMGAFQGKKIVF